jgi:RasGEF domain
MFDFEHMAQQMLSVLATKFQEDGKMRPLPMLTAEGEKLCPRSVLPTSFGPEPLTGSQAQLIFAIDPLEFARQITLVEFELFANVQAYECLDQIWKSKRKKEAMQYRQLRKNEMEGSGVHISRLISHTNQLGFWVATMILEFKDTKQRMQAIKWFIQLAFYCKELKNLTGVTTIMAGLQMGPVERLKKTWTLLAEKFPRIMDRIDLLKQIWASWLL